jgi:MerR family mercuric resistance operon transcriptional regulator
MDAAKETSTMNRTTVNPLTIGEVARLSSVGIETVRFYEREGLLAKPQRTSSGYRQFDEDAVARLQFIRRAKELGFTLNEIKDLLSLRVDAHTSCKDVRTRAEAKIADIEGKIKSLRRMKKALEQLMSECNQRGSESECPILDALEGRSGK